MNQLLILVFALMLGNFPGVSEKKPDAARESKPVSTGTVNYKDNFKRWLRDTIAVIHKYPMSSELGMKQMRFEVSKDSLSLEIFKTYEIALDPAVEVIKPGKVKSVVARLKLDEELPAQKYNLYFLTSNYFYPSVFDRYNFESIFEIKTFIVTTPDAKASYEYFRGGITGKTVTRKINGKQQTEKYEFIKEGNKPLVKRRAAKTAPLQNPY